jgi:hypothetical protein
MNKETIKCPKCGCENIEVIFPALYKEDEIYQCLCCEIIFDNSKILSKQESKVDKNR